MPIHAYRPALAGVLALSLLAPAALAAEVARPDAPKVYRNPVLAGDWSDPDVVRVGDDYYLTASSFVNLPGLPILHSKDLVHWTIIGHALERLPQDDHHRTARKGGGVWAPAIRFHDGLFRIYYPDPDFGIYVVTAKDPAGPWTPPQLVDDSKGAIDPAPFWDEDGAGWLLHGWARSRAGFANRLTLKRLNADGNRTIDAGVTILDGEKLPPVKTSIGLAPWETIEGPKLYKRAGYYYIFAPAGGVKPGWQAVFRSKSLTGPYENRNVLDQGKTPVNGPHQGAWVDTGLGEDWFLHFQDTDSYGRRVHLQPMTWRKDWPVIGVDPDGDGRGEPVVCHAVPKTRTQSQGQPQDTDTFDDGRPSLAWQWNSNPSASWIEPGARPGWLRLRAAPSPASLYEAGAVLTQKLPGLAFSATTTLEFSPLRVGEQAGLAMVGYAYAWIGLERRADGTYLVQKRRDEGGAEKVVLARKLDGSHVTLRLSAEPVVNRMTAAKEGAAWPSKERNFQAEVRFAYSLDGQTFETVDDTFLSREGRWVGAQIGLFSIAPSDTPSYVATSNGYADFDDFQVKVTEPVKPSLDLTPAATCP